MYLFVDAVKHRSAAECATPATPHSWAEGTSAGTTEVPDAGKMRRPYPPLSHDAPAPDVSDHTQQYRSRISHTRCAHVRLGLLLLVGHGWGNHFAHLKW
jgi:hypothetical protein